MKALIIDDGKPHRAEKTAMYALIAEVEGAEVTRARLQNLTAESLKGHDVIITDLEGQLRDNPDNRHFFGLLSEAVQAGAKPKVAMFSGEFTGSTDNDVELSRTPELKGIVRTYEMLNASKVIPMVLGKDIGTAPKKGLGKGTVLAVDEYAPTLAELKDMLGGEGYKVLTAQSPEEALAVWRDNRKDIDIVLTAGLMDRDEKAGLRLTQALRRAQAEIPIIMQSDYVLPASEIDLFKKAGGTEFIHPISLPVLLPALEKHLKAPVRTLN